jgi:hypothetical protein
MRMLSLTLIAIMACGDCCAANAQANCIPGGYRVLAQRWDAILHRGWELRQSCAHPEWPARAVAVSAIVPLRPDGSRPRTVETAPSIQTVHAGEPVRLWLQDAIVRIEMSGVAEQSGRDGDHVTVRIARQTNADGLTIERFTGVVRGVGDVEMER